MAVHRNTVAVNRNIVAEKRNVVTVNRNVVAGNINVAIVNKKVTVVPLAPQFLICWIDGNVTCNHSIFKPEIYRYCTNFCSADRWRLLYVPYRYLGSVKNVAGNGKVLLQCQAETRRIIRVEFG